MNSLFECKQLRALDDYESSLLLKILVANEAGLFRPTKAADLFKDSYDDMPFLLGVIVKRLALAEPELEYNEGTLMFLADISGTRPALAVMWAWSLVQETRKRKHAITPREFSKDLCPLGIPTDEAMHSFWRAQKIDTGSLEDNYLNTEEAWRDHHLSS